MRAAELAFLVEDFFELGHRGGFIDPFFPQQCGGGFALLVQFRVHVFEAVVGLVHLRLEFLSLLIGKVDRLGVVHDELRRAPRFHERIRALRRRVLGLRLRTKDRGGESERKD